MIVAYVSGHGFGHATRTGEVLRVLRSREPRCPLAVVSGAPESLFRDAVSGDFVFRSVSCDVGLVQHDALRIDLESTRARLAAFRSGYDPLVSQEVRWLRESGARLVFGDIPPLAFAAAAGADLPSVGMANFSWDWVYAHLGLDEAASAAASDYARADLLFRLPFAGDLTAFPHLQDVPLVARRPRLSRSVARARLGIDERPLVLLSFGGLGLPGFDPRALGSLQTYQFALSEGVGQCPTHVHRIDAARLGSAQMAYVDLVRACDVVVSKPGYGIVSDAIAAGARMIYTERGDFPEYPIMVKEMPRYLPCVHISNDELSAGHLVEPLRDVLLQPIPAAPDTSGAQVVAEALLSRL